MNFWEYVLLDDVYLVLIMVMMFFLCMISSFWLLIFMVWFVYLLNRMWLLIFMLSVIGVFLLLCLFGLMVRILFWFGFLVVVLGIMMFEVVLVFWFRCLMIMWLCKGWRFIFIFFLIEIEECLGNLFGLLFGRELLVFLCSEC